MNYPKKFAFAALAAMSVATAGCMSMGDNMAMDEQVAYVDGAAMYPTMNIIENAVNSADHETLVAAVKAAGGEARYEAVSVTDAAGLADVFQRVREPLRWVVAALQVESLRQRGPHALDEVVKVGGVDALGELGEDKVFADVGVAAAVLVGAVFLFDDGRGDDHAGPGGDLDAVR